MTHDPDVEDVHVAELLYTLIDRMRAELGRWPDGHPTRGTLIHAIAQLEHVARATVLGTLDLEWSDGFADAGELTLRQIIGMRRILYREHHRRAV